MVGIDVFRWVLRIDPSSLPADPTSIAVLFGYDELIHDPLTTLGPSRRNLEFVHVLQAYVEEQCSTAQTCSFFYRNRLKTTSTVLLHTPDWGLLVRGTDPDNADPGHILLGANPDAAGVRSVELGYEYRMPCSTAARNACSDSPDGRIDLPRHRAALVPTDAAAPETAYWQAIDEYRDELDAMALLPPSLASSNYPARWAQDCIYLAWDVNPLDDWHQGVEVEKLVGETNAVAGASLQGRNQARAGRAPRLLRGRRDARPVPPDRG